MRYIYPIAALICLASGSAQAATCESSFVKGGNPLTGLRFTAQIALPGLTPASAIGQVRGMVQAKGYDVLATEAEGGSMLIEQPQIGRTRGFPITITATTNNDVGTVRMDAKLKPAMTVGSDAVRTELCGILNQIRAGQAGNVAAAKGMTAGANGAPLALSALLLSNQISVEAQRNPASIPARYGSKSFIVNGRVDSLDLTRGIYSVLFDVPEPHDQPLPLSRPTTFKTDIICQMAKGQSVYALQLKPGKSVKLAGVYSHYDDIGHAFVIKDCRPAG
jgi:hypothetical protein